MQGQAQSQYPLTEAGYRIVAEIGHGGSARVYKAECIPTGETVAIKSVDLDRAGCALEDVRKEARTMSLLDHPNVVRAHCSFGAGQALWVVMQYMAGGSCQSIMHSSDAFRHGFDETVIAAVLHQTLLGLNYLHAQGHIHRDIKCGNILMDSRGVVKLGDFGVSASVFDTGDRRERHKTFVGTPCWMAPEVIESESGGVSVNLNSGYDQKADIWSLGITALELAQGHAPLSEMPPMKALLMQLRGAMPPVLDNKRFSKNFRDIVASCLVRDPSRRPSAEKLLKHHFFKHVKGGEYLVRHVLDKVPSLLDRARVCKEVVSDEEVDYKKQRRISGWNFSEHDAKLENFNPNTSVFQFPSDNNIVPQAQNNPNTTDVADSSSKNDHVVDSPKPSGRPLARTSSKLSLALSSSKSNLKDFFDSAKDSPKEMNGGAVVGQSPTGALDRKSSGIFDLGQSPRRGLERLDSGIPDAESPTRGGGGGGGGLERKGSGILELERQLSGKSPKGANGGGGLERKDSLVHKKGRFKITEENIIGNDNNKSGGVDVIHPLPPLRRMHSLSSHPSLSSPTASKLSNLNGRSVDKEVAPEAPLPGSPRCPSNVVMKHLQSLLESTATQRVLLKQLMNSMGVEEVSGEGALDKKVKELEALVASVTQELQDVKARNAHLEERLGNICR